MHKSHRLIHKKLRKHIPAGVRKIKKIFAFRYPKLFLFASLIIFAYFLFSQNVLDGLIVLIEKTGHFGIFVSGLFTGLGFLAPFGFGFLAKLNPPNILIGALIGGAGATLANLLIFKIIKGSVMDEFRQLEKTKVIKEIEVIVNNNKHVLIKHYLLYLFAGLILATPLPDEIGVSMLAGLTTIRPITLAIVGFVLHSTAMFFVLFLF